MALCFAQSPGLVVADTKLDLTGNPVGFLRQAWSLWSDIAPLGQPRNQAYGYIFPHGSFFVLGHIAHIPSWVVQRCWWSALLCLGFVGVVRLAQALQLGTPVTRMIGAAAYLASPRVMTTLGAISSETAPMMLAPWALIPVVRAFQAEEPPDLRKLAARSAGAVALMGAVNAVATAAALLPAFLWWAAHAPVRNGAPAKRWAQFTAWWIPCLLLACAWWISALLLLGSVSPPFLDFIESSQVTTRWTALVEVLRGTDGWTPFVDPARVASSALVSHPVLVFATGLIAAVGLAGLCLARTPRRGLLTTVLAVGVLGVCVGYAGPLGSPTAEAVRVFLDGAGAPLRNVHKLDPLIRLPLVLGLASALAGLPTQAREFWSALAHPERHRVAPVAVLVLMAIALSCSSAWTGRLAPGQGYADLPGYWRDTATWLRGQLALSPPGARALVAPGAPWADQDWGLTRDEPIQALADFPWAVRDAIPLAPPEAIRSLDSVQRLFAAGRPSPGLADTLLGQGFAFLVLRNDLQPDTAHATRPILAHQTVEGSPGLTKVAEFGPLIGAGKIHGAVVDDDLRARYPAVEIYQITPVGPPEHAPVLGPYLVNSGEVPVVQGGAEALLTTTEHARELHDPGSGPILLQADAERAGLTPRLITVTDTPTLRETDYGRVDDHVSAIRAEGDPKRVLNSVADYPAAGAPVVSGVWEGAQVTTSSSVSEVGGLSIVSPGNSPRAAFDGDPSTSWLSAGLDHAVGQWLQLDFDAPVVDPLVQVTVSRALGPSVNRLEISTERGTATLQEVVPDQPAFIAAVSGKTRWLRVTATGTTGGGAGSQFGISQLEVRDGKTGEVVPVRFRVSVPAPSAPGVAAPAVRQWELGQEFPGRPGCVRGPAVTKCANSLTLAPEEPSRFSRALGVASPAEVLPAPFVRSRLSPATTALITGPGRITAFGKSATGDPRGSAFAVVDGDPSTSWTASPDVLKPGAPKPRLTLDLPQPTTVARLRLTQSAGALPAKPTKIAVDLGDGRQVREIDPEQQVVDLDLEPHRTAQVVVTILAWQDMLNVNSLGFAENQPPGLAEIELFDPDGQLAPGSGPLDENRSVTVDCDHGPVVMIGGRVVHTSVTATVGQLRSGAVLRALPCELDPVWLAPGEQAVTVDPGGAFVVESLVLRDVRTPSQAASPRRAEILSWGVDSRSFRIAKSADEQVLVVPESVNPGWQAHAGERGASASLAGGLVLRPITVNGWQQGWLVPPGFEGVVQVSFPRNTWYRAGLAVGLTGLLPLAYLTCKPSRSRRREDAGPATARHAPVLGVFLGLGCAWLVTGWVGLAVAVVFGAGFWQLSRRGADISKWAAVAAGAAMTAAAFVLSLGPWRSAHYLGNSTAPQLLALIALCCVCCSALVERPDRDSIT